MRVVGGKARGRKLAAVPGESTRPILDRVKTALFDILRPEIQRLRVLDLFAGTGGVGIEALSQGAARCVFCDQSPAAIKTIAHNLDHTGLAAQAEVIRTDAFDYLKAGREAFELIYIAPPQYAGLWEKAIEEIDRRPGLLAADGQVIVQIDPAEHKTLNLKHLIEVRQRKYGRTLLVFYRETARSGSAV